MLTPRPARTRIAMAAVAAVTLLGGTAVPAGALQEETVDIPDPVFRACITEHLELPSSSPVSSAQMADILDLDCGRPTTTAPIITDITGAEALTSIQVLSLASNQVTDLAPLNELTTLDVLNLSSQKTLSDLRPLSGLTNLDYLALGANAISDISPLETLTELEGVQLAFNQISDVDPLIGLTKLNYIDLGNNRVYDASALAVHAARGADISMWYQSRRVQGEVGRVMKVPLPRDFTGTPVMPTGCRDFLSKNCLVDATIQDSHLLIIPRAHGDTYVSLEPRSNPRFTAFLTIESPYPSGARLDFRDVPRTHAFTRAIDWVAYQGITSGYADQTFRPSAPISRAHMASFLYRLAGRPPVDLPTASPFPDVSSGSSEYPAIVWLSQQRITGGYVSGRFGPSDTVTRGQMAAFLHRFRGSPTPSDTPAATFPDVSTGSPFHTPITWLVQQEVTSGYVNGLYGVSDPVTRGQMAMFMYRLYH